ncbi:MAG: ABC transporter permease, partial [Ginsengibacter sp.]
MLKNYFTIAWRNLWRNKAFSVINILGLALGLTCSILIMLWIQDEKSIDAFHKNGDRLYQIYERVYINKKPEVFRSAPGLISDELKKVFPEVQYACGLSGYGTGTFAVADKIIKEDGTYASTDFFKMFSYKLLEGNAQTALSSKVGIAISRKMAEEFFGSPESAIGKTILFQNYINFKVNGVFENFSANSSLKFEYLINWETFLEQNPWAKDWNNNATTAYIMLSKDASASAFEKKLIHFIYNYTKDNNKFDLGIQPFGDIYLHNQFRNGIVSGGRIEYVRLLTIVAIFILLIACINFMNLTTARSIKRAKEIGIRKVAGAERATLIRQFIGEAMLITFFA